jgi:lysozyme
MTASTNGYTDPKDYPIQGIDVSKIQGDIDWSAVANSGVKFAWIKATEGVDYVDQRFQANWKGAKAAGVLRGAYHVVDWCHSPNEQMAWFEKNIPADPDALSPALDPGDMYKCGRSPVQPGVIADMKVMLESMEHYFDKPPIIYTPPSLHGAILSVGAFRDYPIWLLRWSEVPPSIGNGYRPWYLWQYTEQGVVDGIHHPVDRNAFYGTSQQWQDFLAAR